MGSVVMKINEKNFNIKPIGISLFILLMGLIVVYGENANTFSSNSNPDLTVVISEDYLNRVIKADLAERNPPAVKDINIQLTENEPIKTNAVIKLGVGPFAVEQQVAVETNVSIEGDALKVEPKLLKVGFLNLSEDTWIGPIKFAMQLFEVSLNEAYQKAIAKGYKVTAVYPGNNTITLSVMAPDNPLDNPFAE
jgi:hypothetical protein